MTEIKDLNVTLTDADLAVEGEIRLANYRRKTSEMAYPDDNPKTAVGLTKPSTAAIPPVAIIELGRAMADGAVKYGRFNWRDKTVTTTVYTDAIDRHMLSFRDGENLATDSKIGHLSHVMACCAILIDALSVGKLNDDRRADGQASKLISDLTVNPR
jgi:hypothetical protein